MEVSKPTVSWKLGQVVTAVTSQSLLIMHAVCKHGVETKRYVGLALNPKAKRVKLKERQTHLSSGNGSVARIRWQL